MTLNQGPSRGTVADDYACLLTYLPSSYPAPIQTGSARTPAQAVLNTAALPGAGQTVYCNQIVIAVPVGTDAGDLFLPAPTASVNTEKWAISSALRRRGRDIGLKDDGDYATFTFDCRDPSDYLIDYNLVFGLEGAVAPVASQCAVRIMENSGTSGDPSTFTSKTCSYTLTTSTPQFYLTNFTAYATDAPSVPATEFANGADINFAWESNGTFFEVYEKGNPKPVYAGTLTSFTLERGVATDTTFVLAAMVSGDPGSEQPQAGYRPVYLYDALTVTVSNPDLTPKSARVAGDASVGRSLRVGPSDFAGARLVSDTGGGPEMSLRCEHRGSNLIVRPLDEGSTSTVIENSSGALVINPGGGNVGIGPNIPTQARLVVNGAGPQQQTGTYGFLNSRNPTGIYNGPQQIAYSIWATGRIASLEFNAFSDERIKDVHGRSDGAADLRTLSAIEVTDYRHKEAPAKGGATHKKLVAQQVERVFPQAVGKVTAAVPDICRSAPFAGGWVEIETDLKAGARVRLISDNAEGVYEVLEVAEGRFRTDFKPEAAEVFVYGREVDDFRTLDYDAVVALNVSATQQLKREKDEEMAAVRAESAALRAANDALIERLNRLESRVEAVVM